MAANLNCFHFTIGIAIVTLSLAVPAQALAGPQDWDDFANNFATDLAPILVLFGEQATKQFLSESTSIWDTIIFGIAPIGVITAVVSAVRLYGSSSLKAFIGRAQEAHGVAEAELCSSTSDDVCELWSNGGICRVFGRPLILEFFRINKPTSDDFYPRFVDGSTAVDTTTPPSCGMYPPKTVLCDAVHDEVPKKTGWVEISDKKADSVEDGSRLREFAPHPNLSLNIGIMPLPRWVLRITAALGTLIQLSFFGYATWVTFYYPELYDEEKGLPSLWSFCLATAGTAILIFGMICCAMLVEGMSTERRFRSKTPTTSTTIFWLQPGDQRVGDQLFNAFAYSKNGDTYITSWKADAAVESQQLGSTRLARSKLRLGVAVGSSCCGFICQFVGLRGLHGSVALYQLAVTLCMAIIRALLRSRRLSAGQNRLKQRRDIEGHELDWQALNVEKPSADEFRGGWYIDDFPSPLKRPHDTTSSAAQEKPDDTRRTYDHGIEVAPGTRGLASFHMQRQRDIDRVQSARAAVSWIKHNEADGHQPNEAARILHYRASLACLTGNMIQAEEERWNTKARAMAIQLKKAMQEAAEYVFSDMALFKGWRESSSLVWSTICRLHDPSPPTPSTSGGDFTEKILPIHFSMHCNAGRWEISECQLEAALGLWSWSVRNQLAATVLDRIRRRKAFMAERREKRDDLVLAIRLWVTQTHAIATDPVKLARPAAAEKHEHGGDREVPEGAPPDNDKTCQFPTTLSVPLMMMMTKSQVEDSGEDGVCLSISTQSSLLQLIAQDIFGIFISRIADIMKPLTIAEPWTRRSQMSNFVSGGDVATGSTADQSYLGLTNTHVRVLADTMVSSGISSREDALMTVIPPLLQRAKLPKTSEVMGSLLRVAKDLRRSNQLSQAENLLRWLIDNVPRELQERAVRALGNLYRNAVRSSDPSDRHFGKVGFEAMKAMETLSEGRQIFDESKRAIEHYISAWDNFFKGATETVTRNRGGGKMKKRSLKELVAKLETEKLAALPDGLCFADTYDLGRAHTDDVAGLLEWAISAMCPELIEDMWSSDRTRGLVAKSWLTTSPDSDTGDYKPGLLSWATDRKVDAETFETLLDWPDLDLSRYRDGTEALIRACDSGNYIAADLLLQRGVPHVADGPALLAAVKGRHESVALRLLAAGTDFIEAFDLTLALHSAIGWDKAIVRSLLEHHADPNASGPDGRTALHVATLRGDTAAVEELLHHGAQFDIRDNDGAYPLLMAVQLGHRAILELFIPDLPRATIELLLLEAVKFERPVIVDLLLAKHASTTAKEEDSGMKGSNGQATTPLIAAAEQGQGEIAEKLLEAKADPNALTSDRSSSPLHAAIKAGNEQIVSAILNPHYNADVNLKIITGQTPLALAVELGQHKIAEQLLRRKAAPDEDLGEAGTVLHLAVEKKDYDMVDLLFKVGEANANTTDGNGRTPLLAVLEAAATTTSTDSHENDAVDEAIVKHLLSAGARPNQRNAAKTSGCLHAALMSRNTRIISTILDESYETDVDLAVDEWQTPLAVAVELDQPRSVELLLKRGANPNAKYRQTGDTVLLLATERRQGKVVDLLLGAKANTETKDDAGRTPLLVALESYKVATSRHRREKNFNIVKSLLRAGADVNAAVGDTTEEGRTMISALHLAVQNNSSAMVQLLTGDTECHTNVEVQNEQGLTPLLAILSSPCQRLAQQQREIVRLLLGAGADVNAKGSKYGNALQAAAHHGGEFLVHELLQHEPKIDVNAPGGHFGTALQAACAAAGGEEEVVELLLNHGADPSKQSGAHGSALLAALMTMNKHNKKVVEMLLLRGADTEAEHPNSGLTALHVAIDRRLDIDTIILLVQHKANVEAAGRKGRIPLLLAAGTGDMKLAEVLLDGGAGTEVRESRSGRTPLLIASDRGDYNMVKLLLQRGADANAKGGTYENAMRAALYRQDNTAEKMLRSFGGRV